MKLTSEVLAAAYRYLSLTEPFAGWNMPAAGKVKFHVTSHHDRYADCLGRRIRVSRNLVYDTTQLMRTMAHEMVHLHLEEVGSKTNEDHGPDFQRCANQACKAHGFQREGF